MIHNETGIPGSFLHRAARKAALAAAALLLAGCVTQPNGDSTMGLDVTEVFATKVGAFRLQDGSEGVLRRDSDGVYIVKLEGSRRLLRLEAVITARIARVENIGTRTVVLLETERADCRYKYDLLAIQGGDLLQWGLGNCRDRPRVAVADGGRALYVDFPKPNRLQRITYADGHVLSKSIAAPAGVNPALRPFADANLNADPTASVPPPDPHQAADNADGPAEQRPSMRIELAPNELAAPAPAAAPAGNKAPPAASLPARRKPVNSDQSAPPNAALNFPPHEIPATHLDLRK